MEKSINAKKKKTNRINNSIFFVDLIVGIHLEFVYFVSLYFDHIWLCSELYLTFIYLLSAALSINRYNTISHSNRYIFDFPPIRCIYSWQ